ncbi:hypothetical protein COOONC_10336, partial [Cooperia oncophora]
LKKELRQAQAQLEKIKSALPPLPTPDKLYQDIVHCCSEVLYLVDLIDNLKEDISYFFDNNEPWKILEREARIKELTIASSTKATLSLLLDCSRYYLYEYDLREGMGLTDEHSSAVYEHIWKEVHVADFTKAIERILTDQEEVIKELFTKIKDIRAECLLQERYRQDVSNKRICDSLKEIKEELDQLRGSLQDNRDGRVSESEQARIAENVEFMERTTTTTGRRKQPPDEEKESIFEEIHHLEQELKQVHNKIRELAALRRCRPRQYEEGITREEETTMRCAFCFAEGRHYSDSCPEVRTVEERLDSLRRRRRCTICLDIECDMGYFCPKYSKRCHHCHKAGHASAVCTLPEESLDILARKRDYEITADQILRRLEELRRAL